MMFPRIYEANDGHDHVDVYPTAHHRVILADIEALLVEHELDATLAPMVADIMESAQINAWAAMRTVKQSLEIEGALGE